MRIGTFYGNNYIKHEKSGNKKKTLSLKKYLDKNTPCMKDVNNYKKSETRKIQLTTAIYHNFSRETDEKRVMQPKSDNMEKQMKLSKNYLNHFLKDIRLEWKHK